MENHNETNNNNSRIYRKNIRETLNTHVSIDKQIKCCAFACPSAGPYVSGVVFFLFFLKSFLPCPRPLGELVRFSSPLYGVFNFDKFISNSLSQQATCKHVLKATMEQQQQRPQRFASLLSQGNNACKMVRKYTNDVMNECLAWDGPGLTSQEAFCLKSKGYVADKYARWGDSHANWKRPRPACLNDWRNWLTACLPACRFSTRTFNISALCCTTHVGVVKLAIIAKMLVKQQRKYIAINLHSMLKVSGVDWYDE